MKKRPVKFNLVILVGLIMVLAVGAGAAEEEAAVSNSKDGKTKGDSKESVVEKSDSSEKSEAGVSLDGDNPCIPLEEHKTFLNEELEKIKRERRALEAMRVEIKAEIMEMEKSRKAVNALFEKMDERKAKRIKKLVKVYQGMEAEAVVPLLENLEEDIMLAVLYRMKEKKQAAIMALMDPARAASISEKLIVSKVE